MEIDGEFWNKYYSTIYIFESAKSALFITTTNQSAVNTRAANQSAYDIKFTAAVLAILPGLIIPRAQRLTATESVRNVVAVYVGKI